LNHHNTNMKKDALAGLQELVVSHGVLAHNLDKILERVAALTSDLESVVRKENLKLAELMFQRVMYHINELLMELFKETIIIMYFQCMCVGRRDSNAAFLEPIADPSSMHFNSFKSNC